MKERPILFSAPMVRAILSGTKSQTRRALRVQPPVGTEWMNTYHHPKDAERPYWWAGAGGDLLDFSAPCPYGQPGDRLWVREAWMPDPPCDGTWGYTEWAGSRIGQIAAVPERFQHPAFCNYRASWLHGTGGLRWTPGIHMPRWASRITLEVTSVRVERLQDISEKDAWAEGCEGYDDDVTGGKSGYSEFHDLWEQINGPESWAANPWVWCVSFRRLEAA